LTTFHLVYKSGGKGFHGVVHTPLRLIYIPDILAQAEEGRPFIRFP